MKESLIFVPEDNIHLEIQIKLKDTMASSCSLFSFIYFILNVASIILILEITGCVYTDVIAVEIPAWFNILFIIAFICCTSKTKCSMTIFVMSVVFSITMSINVGLMTPSLLHKNWLFLPYLIFCFIRLSIYIYLVIKMKALNNFDKEIHKLTQRINKPKKREKGDLNVLLLENLITIDEEWIFQYSCTGSASPSIKTVSEVDELDQCNYS